MATNKETQQFCVRWNSYQSNLQSAFPKLLSCEHFVDVTLACESRMVKCHKVVLSACSAYFEKLLVQNPCQHPIIFMKDMKFWEVQALVDFMYKGEVNVTQDELATLLKAAEALEVRGLCGQQEGLAEKLTLPRSSDSTTDGRSALTTGEPLQKTRRVEAVVKEEQPSSASDSAHSTSQNNPPTPDQPPRSTSSLTVANVKQESRFSDNGGLFDDFDDDFYQDDNSLQIDETGSAYSLPGPSTQLDSSPGVKYSLCGSWLTGQESPEECEETNENLDYSAFVNGAAQIPTGNKWRRDHRIYSLATRDLLSGESLIAVATKYNIPRSTLHDYLKKSGLIPAWRKSRQAANIMKNRSNAKNSTKTPQNLNEVKISKKLPSSTTLTRKRKTKINPLDIFMSMNSLWTDSQIESECESINQELYQRIIPELHDKVPDNPPPESSLNIEPIPLQVTVKQASEEPCKPESENPEKSPKSPDKANNKTDPVS